CAAFPCQRRDTGGVGGALCLLKSPAYSATCAGSVPPPSRARPCAPHDRRKTGMDGIVLNDVTTWGPWIINWGTNFVTALVILALGWWLSGLLGRTVERSATRSSRIDPTIVPMLRTVVMWAIRVFTVIAVLARFGVHTASLIAVLGAAGLAIGLALQGTLQNIAAGIMLISLRPLRTGEYVSLNNAYEGTVAEVGLFLTRLVQLDGITVTLPNSVVWNAT